jgi:hypothetical protein
MTTAARLAQLQVAGPAAAVAVFLSAQPQVVQLLGKNSWGTPAVYRPQIPKSEDSLMPQGAISVRYAGGVDMFSGSRLPVSTPRVDITCFAAERQQADEIASAVFVVSKQLNMETWENVMLYWLKPQHPVPLPDTQTLWPASVVTAQLMHGDYATA